jgi:uncharacterized membrane protein YGL010W
MMNPKLHALMAEYTDCHRHPINRLTHKIAIPFIVFHILAMLSWVPLATVAGVALHAGHVGWLIAVAWYLTMHLRLGLILAVLFGLCLPLAAVVPKPAVIAIAAVGWLVQLAGHVVWEKRQPAFLRNLLQALVGPLYFVALLTGDWKVDGSAAQTQPS